MEQCKECAKEAPKNREPLIVTSLPNYPWQMVGVDLFELNKDHYLLIVDYFSRYPEVIQLTSTTSAAVVKVMKSIFSRNGVPEVVRSDNGPQFSAEEFAKFASSYGFQHVSSNPRYAQSNGQVECMVRTVKKMILKPDDPYLAIISYWSTPHPWCNLSPGELLMGRRIRTILQTNSCYHLTGHTCQFQEKTKRSRKAKRNSLIDDTE